MFLALDLETTGLDPQHDRILQVAWQPLDNKLNPLDDVHTCLAHASDYALRRIEENPYILEMHSKTGLWAALQDPVVNKLGTSDIADLILKNLDTLQPEGDLVHLLGASVHFDRSFIDYWMPNVAARLNHRILDVSSLKLLAKSFGSELSAQNPHPHNAVFDVLESIEVARHAKELMSRGVAYA